MDIRIAPSILSADFANLETELESISHADLIHVDVMDGHFVPNMTLGLPIVKRLFEVSKVPLDVHLMIDNPEHWAGQYGKYASSVTFHFEAANVPLEVISKIRESGARTAMSIKPGTSFESISNLVQHLDMLLVMTVEPGFGGQSFMTDMLEKVKEARSIINNQNLKMWVQVDGGVGLKTIEQATRAGADFLVVGSAAFSAQDPGIAMKELRELAIKGSIN
jgi:ribulose-phosphate 3-epimerase